MSTNVLPSLPPALFFFSVTFLHSPLLHFFLPFLSFLLLIPVHLYFFLSFPPPFLFLSTLNLHFRSFLFFFFPFYKNYQTFIANTYIMRILPLSFSSFFIPISAYLALLTFLLPFSPRLCLCILFIKMTFLHYMKVLSFFICTINIGIPIFVYPSEEKEKISGARISLA